MHRHGSRVPKLGRERDQRRALIKGLATALIEEESIETTLVRAKALRPYTEKLITKAKKGDLHNRRQIISAVATIESANKLVDEIAPKLTARNSGFLRIEKTDARRGDSAPMARISFVDDLTAEATPENTVTTAKAAKKTSSPQAKQKQPEPKKATAKAKETA